MPQPAPPVKPPRRFWLFAPYALVGAAALVWTLVWLAISHEIAARMDAEAAELRAAGWTVDWADRTIDGYPFRIRVTLERPRLREPAGWGFEAPSLKAQAYAYDLTHWIMYAPAGVTLQRPTGGPVAVDGLLRASVSGAGAGLPRIAVEGANLVFTPAKGSIAFPLSRAAHLGFFLRSSDGGRAEAYANFDGAVSAPNTLLGRMSGGKTTAMLADLFVDKAELLSGPSVAAAVRRWSAAGGTVQIVRAGLAGDGAWLGVRPGAIGLDQDGRLRGSLGLLAYGAPKIVRRLGSQGEINSLAAEAAAEIVEITEDAQGHTRLNLNFVAGVTTIGPIPVGRSPKVY
jgi:hypothetical protein